MAWHGAPPPRHTSNVPTPCAPRRRDVRLAAAQALAAVAVTQDGRDAIRTGGGLRPLVLLLGEGVDTPVTVASSLAIMNCSTCDICKVPGEVVCGSRCGIALAFGQNMQRTGGGGVCMRP